MSMKPGKKRVIILVAVILLIAALALIFTRKGAQDQEKYTMTKIDRGDLEAVVSSTGTLGAVTTVQVGTQVSGRIAKIYTDFNRTVKKGDLLAMLDTSSLLMAVSEAESSYEKAKAQLKQAKQDLERMQYLFKENIKTKNDLEQAQVNYELASATLKSAQSNLERTRINLGYASIFAPIDGIVIARNIDVGQTVAASFSSPTLFLIANDLSKMQILANVDESDIGQIKEEQEVRFTVQAQPNRNFSGQVSQIRLEPTTIEQRGQLHGGHQRGQQGRAASARHDRHHRLPRRPGQERPARGQRRPAREAQPGDARGDHEAVRGRRRRSGSPAGRAARRRRRLSRARRQRQRQRQAAQGRRP